MDEEEHQRVIIDGLIARLDENDNNRKDIQEKLHEVCNALKRKIDEMKDKINETLEREFVHEDERLQRAFNEVFSLSTETKVIFSCCYKRPRQNFS